MSYSQAPNRLFFFLILLIAKLALNCIRVYIHDSRLKMIAHRLCFEKKTASIWVLLLFAYEYISLDSQFRTIYFNCICAIALFDAHICGYIFLYTIWVECLFWTLYIEYFCIRLACKYLSSSIYLSTYYT